MKRIIATILFLLITSYVLADHHEETDKDKIKSAYSAYVDDFMVGDFKAIANKFPYPATFNKPNPPRGTHPFVRRDS